MTTFTFSPHCQWWGFLSSPPKHLSVSSPGGSEKGQFKPIVLSIPRKYNMCVAALSMFTVNGSLCYKCLLSILQINPHIYKNPDANPSIVLIELMLHKGKRV